MNERVDDRQHMVEQQLRQRGIDDRRVLAAMAEVPRHYFIAKDMEARAYADMALPIAAGQTISQPYVVALMAQELLMAPAARVLEVGAGSGYAAAVLSRLAAEVYTIERVPELATAAQQRFHRLSYRNIQMLVGDGSSGWPEHAPYNAITVAAATSHVPQPLCDQLADGGHMVLPLGNQDEQWLVRITRRGAHLAQQRICAVRFVPLIGAWVPGQEHGPDGEA